jgi:restriction endonuclease
MTTDWKAAEHLAKQVYRELLGRASVKWNDNVYGHESEMNRQIDVSIRWHADGSDYLTIVQVKDWKKKADVNDVGTFSAVVQDVRASQGIMVCRLGFSKKAVVYARNRGIQLHTLHDAQSMRWNQSLTIPIVWIDWAVELRFQAEGKFDAGDSIDFSSFRAKRDGDNIDVKDIFCHQWNCGIVERRDGGPYRFDPGENMVVAASRPNGAVVERNVSKLRGEYMARRSTYLGRFSPDNCRGVVDYLNNDAFILSYLPADQLPLRRNENWQRIDGLERLAIETRGTFVTMEQFGVDPTKAEVQLSAKFLRP